MSWFVFRHAGLDPASRDFNVSFILDSGRLPDGSLFVRSAEPTAFRRNDDLSNGNEIFLSFVATNKA
jgi:hypothetical protein